MVSGTSLVRIVRAAAGPGSLDGAVTTVLVGDVDAFRVQAYDGATWLDTWPGETSETQPRLRAVRVEIASARFRGKTSWQSEFFIPAGMVVTSTLVRGRSN